MLHVLSVPIECSAVLVISEIELDGLANANRSLYQLSYSPYGLRMIVRKAVVLTYVAKRTFAKTLTTLDENSLVPERIKRMD